MNDLTSILIWVVVIGVAFGFAWKYGYLAKITAYCIETREELKKCSWPSVEELKGSTVVVMVTMCLLGGFTVGIDFVLSQLMRVLLAVG